MCVVTAVPTSGQRTVGFSCFGASLVTAPFELPSVGFVMRCVVALTKIAPFGYSHVKPIVISS